MKNLVLRKLKNICVITVCLMMTAVTLFPSAVWMEYSYAGESESAQQTKDDGALLREQAIPAANLGRVPVRIRKVWETDGTQEQLNEQKQPVHFRVYGGSEKILLTPYAGAEGDQQAEATLTQADAEEPQDPDCNVWVKTVYLPKGYVQDGQTRLFTDQTVASEAAESNGSADSSETADGTGSIDIESAAEDPEILSNLIYTVEEDTDSLTVNGDQGAWEAPEISYEPGYTEPGVTRPATEQRFDRAQYSNFKYTRYVTFKSSKKVKNVAVRLRNGNGDICVCTVSTSNTYVNGSITLGIPVKCPEAFGDAELDGDLTLYCEETYSTGGLGTDTRIVERSAEGTLHNSVPGGAHMITNTTSTGEATIYFAEYTSPEVVTPITLTMTNTYRPIQRVEVYVQKKWQITHGSQADLDAQKQPITFTVTGREGDQTYELPAYEHKTGDARVTTLTSADATNDPNLWERSVWVPDGIIQGSQGVFFGSNGEYSFSVTEDIASLSLPEDGYWDETTAEVSTKTFAGEEPSNEFGKYRIAFRAGRDVQTEPRSAQKIYIEFTYTDENKVAGKKAKLFIDLGTPKKLPTNATKIFNLKDVRIPEIWTGYKETSNNVTYFAIDYIELDGVDFTDKFTDKNVDETTGKDYYQLRLYRNNPSFGPSDLSDNFDPLTTDMYRLVYKDSHGKEVVVGKAEAQDTVSPCLRLTNTYMTQPLCKIVDTNRREHAFYSLQEAVAWSRDHRDAAYSDGTATIQMLVDYSMEAGDRLALKEGDNIRLTTAARAGGEKFKFKGLGASAVITRSSGFETESMITASEGASLCLTGITLDGGGSASDCRADGNLVQVKRGGSLNVTAGAVLRNGWTTGRGAGIYLASGADLRLSADPQFSGNQLYDASLAGKTRGAAKLTAAVPQDIYLNHVAEDTASEDVASEICVDGDLSCDQHSIAVWAADANHCRQDRQFATIRQGVSADPAVFWNPRPDEDTDNRTGEDLPGVLSKTQGQIKWARNAAILTVENAIDMTSDYAVKTDRFSVSVTLMKDADGTEVIADKQIPEAAEGVDLERVETEGRLTALTYSKTLGDKDSFAVEVPVGWTYVVNEDSGGYTVTYRLRGGEGESSATDAGFTGVIEEDTTVCLTNSRDSLPLTGVEDSDHRGLIITILALLALAGLGFALRVYRKRRKILS